ncbi:MAG: hypothetical protein V4695_07170 [Pseudomonadota bacterium]
MSAFVFNSKPAYVRRQTSDSVKIDDVAAVGDWTLYRRRCAYVNASTTIDLEVAQALKRRFCLAYLGNRAQKAGGTYMTPGASVFTPKFVERMARQNAQERAATHPALAALVAQLLADEQSRAAPRQKNLLGLGQERQSFHLHLVSDRSAT